MGLIWLGMETGFVEVYRGYGGSGKGVVSGFWGGGEEPLLVSSLEDRLLFWLTWEGLLSLLQYVLFIFMGYGLKI